MEEARDRTQEAVDTFSTALANASLLVEPDVLQSSLKRLDATLQELVAAVSRVQEGYLDHDADAVVRQKSDALEQLWSPFEDVLSEVMTSAFEALRPTVAEERSVGDR